VRKLGVLTPMRGVRETPCLKETFQIVYNRCYGVVLSEKKRNAEVIMYPCGRSQPITNSLEPAGWV